MGDRPHCSKCGTPAGGASPGGLCPVCLLALGVSGPDSEDATTPRAISGTVPETIDEFRIVEELGRGGMGVVYRAFQPSMNRTVALKVLDTELMPSEREATRFEREAWIGGRLSHPNIVKVYAHGTAGPRRWFAMELIEGRALGAEIRSMRETRKGGSESRTTRQRSEIQRIVRLFVGVADALAAVHRQGILHRDIKPLNLLLTPERDRLLLSDFGLALDARTSRLTRRGDFLGTIRYMSPELLLARRVSVDHRTDIWSFGVSLYEALTLELPFSGDSEEAYIASVSVRDAADARRHNRAIPAELEAVLSKCLERDPEHRYQSAEQLREDLELFLEDRPPKHARRRGPIRRSIRFARRHRKLLLAAAAAGLLVAVGLGSWAAWRVERQKQDWVRSALRLLAEEERNWGDLTAEEWERLLPSARSAARDDPHGETAALARRASLHLVTMLPTSAAAKPMSSVRQTQMYVAADVRFLPGASLDYLVTWETSWDGQPFRTVSWCLLDSVPQGSGPVGGVPLDELAGVPVVTSSPHQVGVRTTVWNLRDGDWRGDPRFRRLSFSDIGAVLERGAPPESLLEALEPTLIEKIVRERRPFSISVFDAYSPGFPRPASRVEAEAAGGLCPVPDRVVIVYSRVPSSSGDCLIVDPGGLMVRLPFEPPLGLDHPPYLLVKVSLEAPEGKHGCTPLAGRHEVRINAARDALFSFNDQLDEGIAGSFQACFAVPSFLQLEIKIPGVDIRSTNCTLRGVAASPLVGSVEGTWSYTPAREVALEPDSPLASYLGEPASFPVTIETRVVDSRWEPPVER